MGSTETVKRYGTQSRTNPNHWNVEIGRSIGVCALHRAERDAVPAGRARGWPASINFGEIGSRLARSDEVLRNLIVHPAGHRLFDILVEKVSNGLNIQSSSGRLALGSPIGCG